MKRPGGYARCHLRDATRLIGVRLGKCGWPTVALARIPLPNHAEILSTHFDHSMRIGSLQLLLNAESVQRSACIPRAKVPCIAEDT